MPLMGSKPGYRMGVLTYKTTGLTVAGMKHISRKSEIIAIGTEGIAVQGDNTTAIGAVLKQAGVARGHCYN